MNMPSLLHLYLEALGDFYENYDYSSIRLSMRLSPSQQRPSLAEITTVTPCITTNTQGYSKIIHLQLFDDEGRNIGPIDRGGIFTICRAHQLSAKRPDDIHRFDSRWFDRNGNRLKERLEASHNCHCPDCLAPGHTHDTSHQKNCGMCGQEGFLLYKNRMIVTSPTCKCPVRCMGVHYVENMRVNESEEWLKKDFNKELNEIRGEGIAEYIRLPNDTFMENPKYSGDGNKGTFLNVSFLEYNYDYHVFTSHGYSK